MSARIIIDKDDQALILVAADRLLELLEVVPAGHYDHGTINLAAGLREIVS